MIELVVLLALAVLGFLFIAPIVALCRSAALMRRIDDLEGEVKRLRSEASRPAGEAAPAAAPQAVEEPAPEPPPPSPIVHAAEPWWPPVTIPESEADIRPKPEAGEEPEVEKEPEPAAPTAGRLDRIFAPPPPPPPAPPISPVPSRPSRSREEWELIIGGNWLNRIGAVVILFFAGFLLKYAFDHNWITPLARIVLGLVFGGGLAALGVRFHRRGAPVFGQGLMGAGISVLYLTAYASYNVYNLLPQSAALALMSAVTACAVTLAIRCDAISVSLLGLVGGFLTPLLVSGGAGKGASSGIGLFAYVALLDTGLLLVAVKRDSWAVLEPLVLIGTWATYLVWRMDYYTHASISFTIPFVVVFWGLFYALDIYRAVKSIDTFVEPRMAVASLNSLFFYAALYYDVSRQLHPWTGLATILVALAYFAAVLAAVRSRVTNPTVIPRCVLTAIVLLAVATRVQFTGYPLSLLWAVEALALVWCGLRYRMRLVWAAALGLMGLATIDLLATKSAFGYEHIRAFDLILNLRFLAYAVVAAAIGSAAALFGRSDEESRDDIAPVLHFAWVAVGFAALTIETNDLFRRIEALRPGGNLVLSYDRVRFLTMGAVWLAYSLPLVACGLWRRVETVLQLGLAVLFAGFACVAGWALEFEPIASFTPVLNVRVGFLLIAVAVLACQRLVLARRVGDHRWAPAAVRLIDAGAALVGLELISVEIGDYAGLIGGSHGQALWLGMSTEKARDILWAAVWAVYSIPLVAIAIRKRHVPIACVGSGAMIMAALTIPFVGAAFEPLRAFGAVLNLRVGGFLVVALALIALKRVLLAGRLDEYPWIGGLAGLLGAGAALLGWELITVEIADYARLLEALPHGPALWLAMSAENARWVLWAAAWAVYSVPLIWLAVRKIDVPIACVGSGAIGLAALTIPFTGAMYEPLRGFTAVLNIRAGGFVVVALALLALQRIMLAGRADEHPWMPGLGRLLGAGAALLGWELITVEIADYARLLDARSPGSALWLGMLTGSTRWVLLAAAWAIYAVPLIVAAVRRSHAPVACVASGSLVLAVLAVAFGGAIYEPLRDFSTLLNLRAAAFVIVALALLVHRREIQRLASQYEFIRPAGVALAVVSSLLIFELLTVETWDTFSKAIAMGVGRGPNIESMRQLGLSVVWLVYSFVLLSWGLWRRQVALRYVAMAIYAVTILKVFLSDLSFLDTLYRIFSFLALGLVLLLTSYLYQRYKSVILGEVR